MRICTLNIWLGSLGTIVISILALLSYDSPRFWVMLLMLVTQVPALVMGIYGYFHDHP